MKKNGKDGNFSGVNFNDKFSYENLTLSDINLKRADLKGATLDNIKAVEIDFMEANLENATLQGADISGAVMVYANLKNTDMSNVNKDATSFSNAWWSDGTRCSADSIGECKKKTYETKLTYEDYLQNTSEVNEYIKKFEDKANEGQTFTDTSLSEKTIDVDPAGIWIGYQSVVNYGTYDMRTIVYDGEFYGASLDANILFSGTYETKSGAYLVANGYEDSNTSYKMYDKNNGQAFSRGVMALKINPEESLEGAFENDIFQEGSIKASFSKLYNNPSSLKYLSGSINKEDLNITVESSGVFSGTKYDCKIEGNIEVPDKEINVYKLSYTLSTCADSGSYKGLGIIVLDNNYNASFLAFASNSLRMEGLFYGLGSTNEK